MPGYGVQGPEQGTGLLPWAWAEEQLTRSRNYWLATRWPDGQPHVMPIWGAWHQASLWFSSSKRSRKARNLMDDPRCAVTTEDALNPVVVQGTAELLAAPADLELLLALINAKYQTDYGLDMVDPALNSTFRVRPARVIALQSDDFTGSPTRWTVRG